MANVSHELKTPLNAILGFSDLMATLADNMGPDQIREYAGLIHQGGTNLFKLYASATAAISTKVQTALWPLTDVIRDKQALKLGVEMTTTTGTTLNLTVDSEYNSSPVYVLGNFIDWINNSISNKYCSCSEPIAEFFFIVHDQFHRSFIKITP